MTDAPARAGFDTVTTPGAAALPLAHVLPISAQVNATGRLAVGGCDLRDLADRFGTPLYVYDTATLRAQLRGYREAFAAAYPDSELVYASKAFLNRPFAKFIASEGFGCIGIQVPACVQCTQPEPPLLNGGMRLEQQSVRAFRGAVRAILGEVALVVERRTQFKA